MMFRLLKFKNVKTKISLLIPFAAFAVSAALTFLLTSIGMPLYMTVMVIFAIVCVLAAVNYNFVPANDCLSKKDMMKYYFSRCFYTVVMYILITLACSIGINMISDAVIGTVFARINSVAGEYINETFLFLCTLFILSRVALRNGYSDTVAKRYNPHMVLGPMIFAFAVIFPVIFTDYIFFLMVGEQIFAGGVVLSRSQFITSYLSAHMGFGFAGCIAGYMIQTALGTLAMLYYYSEGRRNFFARHPNNIEYDKDEISGFLSNS